MIHIQIHIHSIFAFLGCPSAQHLAGTGIGHIGIVDYDIVEINNLHRQLLHTEDSIGTPKVESLKRAITSLNSNVEVSTFHTQLTSTNCFDILKNFDIILDCTDNVATRYLLNDACVMLRKPLVSGSALQYEGQLTVYNYNNGPCYRCLFPIPPNPESVTNCSDSGVVATVTGVIGTMQAMEALKIIQNMNGILYGKLLIYDALEATFRNVKLRTRKIECMVCGESPTIKELIDYEEFCGMKANDKDMHLNILEENDRIAVGDYKKYYLDRKEKKHILIDVRNINEFEICQLPGSLNIPMKELLDDRKSSEILKKLKYDTNQSEIDIFTVCRRGNDSQLAVNRLKSLLPNANIKDLIGGLHAWTKTIDSSFPIY